MDSGNSGSLQSSSGGDEEYDSRAADFITAPPFFDPLNSNYLPLLNSAPAWPIIRPAPNQHIITRPNSSSAPMVPCFQQAAGALPRVDTVAARGSKKRSRASRRAPTTVLTTDTTNFRAMVQEFTGIPSPPFNSSAAAFPRNINRLDLFSTRSAATPPPYLRRPFPQKASLLSATSSSSSYQLPNTTTNLFNSSNPLLTSFLESNPKLIPFPKMGGLDEQFSVAPTDTLAGLIQNNNNINAAAAAARWNNDQNDDVSRDDGAYKAAAGRGEGMVESWLCSSE